MASEKETRWTAFEGFRCIASGDRAKVVLEAKTVLDRGEQAPVLIFNDDTGWQIDVDWRGTPDDVLKRLSPSPAEPIIGLDDPAQDAPRGPGRPRLGVVAREVTLLPRHWDWLNSQPGGASVALRKLVEHARRDNEGKDRLRQAQEATYRVMSALAGDLPGFEEAARALFAKDPERFANYISDWPGDVRRHLARLVQTAMRLESMSKE
jgi:hypothetical protein